MTEAWRPIPGYETLYAVSDEGRVKSLRNGRVMSPVLDGHGYPTVRLYRAGNDRRFFIHRLVASTFHADKQNVLHCEAAHLDGNPLNARADNLKWVSPRENTSHKRLHGTHQAGEKHPLAKLTWPQVNAIRASNRTRVEIATEFGISPWTVKDIRGGKRWKPASATGEAGDAQC